MLTYPALIVFIRIYKNKPQENMAKEEILHYKGKRSPSASNQGVAWGEKDRAWNGEPLREKRYTMSRTENDRKIHKNTANE